MPTDDLELISPELERSLEAPYEGLFGDTVAARVLQEIVADPYRKLRASEIARVTDSSAVSVRTTLKKLAELGILLADPVNRRATVYTPNLGSKRFIALTSLAYAVLDDRVGSSLMDDFILDYARLTRGQIQINYFQQNFQQSNYILYESEQNKVLEQYNIPGSAIQALRAGAAK